MSIVNPFRCDAPMRGVSLVPALRDPQKSFDRAIFQHFPGYLGAGDNQWRTTPVGVIQRGNWKLMEFFEDGRFELYSLAKDVGEQKNLAEAQPDKLQKLHAEMLEWRTSVGAKMPAKNDREAPELKTKKKNKRKGKISLSPDRFHAADCMRSKPRSSQLGAPAVGRVVI